MFCLNLLSMNLSQQAFDTLVHCLNSITNDVDVIDCLSLRDDAFDAFFKQLHIRLSDDGCPFDGGFLFVCQIQKLETI